MLGEAFSGSSPDWANPLSIILGTYSHAPMGDAEPGAHSNELQFPLHEKGSPGFVQ